MANEVPRQCFLLFMFRVCHAFLSVHCSLMAICLERADLLDLWYVMFNCVFVTFPCNVLGQVWCLIVSIPDLCRISYFDFAKCHYESDSALFTQPNSSRLHSTPANLENVRSARYIGTTITENMDGVKISLIFRPKHLRL